MKRFIIVITAIFLAMLISFIFLNNKSFKEIINFNEEPYRISNIQFVQDNLVYSTWTSEIKEFNFETKNVRKIYHQKRIIETFKFLDNDGIISFSSREPYRLSLYNLKESKVYEFKDNFQNEINAIAISNCINNQFIIAGSSDGIIRVWDFNTKKLINIFDFETQINKIEVLNDNLVLFKDLNSIYKVDLTTGNKDCLVTSKGNIYDFILTKDRSLMYYSDLDGIKLINLKDMSKNQKIIYPTKKVAAYSLEISPNEQYLAVGFDNSYVKTINIKNGKESMVGRLKGSPVFFVKWSPDGKYLSGSSRFNLKIWEKIKGNF